MKEQLVTFETATMAKEKGLGRGSRNIWHRSGAYTMTSSSIYREIGARIMYNHDGYLEAPTQSQLQTILREQKQVFVEVQLDATTAPKFSWQVMKFVGNPRDLSEGEWFYKPIEKAQHLERTYEDALEEALKSALKYAI